MSQQEQKIQKHLIIRQLVLWISDSNARMARKLTCPKWRQLEIEYDAKEQEETIRYHL